MTDPLTGNVVRVRVLMLLTKMRWAEVGMHRLPLNYFAEFIPIRFSETHHKGEITQ